MDGRIIDLSLDIYDSAPTFANDPECTVATYHTIESTGYNITRLSMSTHQGTHLDAPSHFFNNGTAVDCLPLERVNGKAIKIDLCHKKPKEPITLEDMLPFQENIFKGSRIIYQTGWDKIFPDKTYFTDFPYLSKELAEWLASREIFLLGMDTPTPNPIDWLAVHHSLLGKGIVIVEGLANLEKLVENEFFFSAAPLKIQGRDGSPVRAFAIEGLLNMG
jgi:Predicted metal-dependent hydrolase